MITTLSTSSTSEELNVILQRDVIVKPNFISENEEATLLKEIDPHLSRIKYMSSHWDDAIQNYREIERKNWNANNKMTIDKLRQHTLECYPTPLVLLPLTHCLDLSGDGEIRPHVDSVRATGLLSTISVVKKKEPVELETAEESRRVVLRRTETNGHGKNCPILVRIFYSTEIKSIPMSLYTSGRMPKNEIQINTWPSAKLKDLAREVRYACREANKRGARLIFSSVYVAPSKNFKRKPLGVVITGHSSSLNKEQGSPEADDSEVRLNANNFKVGDFIEVHVMRSSPSRRLRTDQAIVPESDFRTVNRRF
ncbi:hypothetical protein Ciccas_002159 [Cichlidogyrus casuarinus]|uniref:Uncharacterized protein n=1 Tax=Cichlidogyrus casuarinus TaxID=1844966 RepID=A0ABD2QI04_9PLAT